MSKRGSVMKTTVVRICWILALALVLLSPLMLLLFSGLISWAGAQEGQKEIPHYVGAEKCAKICHSSEKQGGQLIIWQESKHAKAYETLGTPRAKEFARARGVEDPQQSEKCLKCHTTAPGVADGLKDPGFSNTEGIGCERCHGPGSLYKKLAVMKDRKQAVANGLIIPDEKTCVGCHNEESPSYKPFNFEERWKKTIHRKPGKEG